VRVKTALAVPPFPSVSVTSSIVIVGWPSSSMIVPTPTSSARVAFTGAERARKYVSLTSSTVSPLMVTVTGFDVSPAAKLRVVSLRAT
jgi:hypothetical protein